MLSKASPSLPRTIRRKLWIRKYDGTPQAKWFNCKGDANYDGTGGTENTDKINHALDVVVADGLGALDFGRGNFACGGQINLNQRNCIALSGRGGISPGFSGHFIDARSSFAVRIRGFGLRYASSLFTGDLLDFSHSTSADATYMAIEDCMLGGYSGLTSSARRLINLDAAILGSVTKCHMAWAKVGVGGVSTPGYSNVHTVDTCTFGDLTTSAIMNAAEGWTVRACGFEGANMPRAYYDDMAAGTMITTGMSWIGNWHGDGAAVSDDLRPAFGAVSGRSERSEGSRSSAELLGTIIPAGSPAPRG
jgi:hypothetical protein